MKMSSWEMKSIRDDFLFQIVMVDDSSYDLKIICDDFSFQFVTVDAAIIIEMSPNLVSSSTHWCSITKFYILLHIYVKFVTPTLNITLETL
jgi:hypothetical protein